MAPQTTVVTGVDNPIGPAEVARDNNQTNESNTVSKRKIGLGRRITNKINGFLERGFERIGNIVANNPWKTILISLICAGLCTLGLLEYSVENRGEKNWVSQSSVTLDYKDWIDETFPKKFRQISVMVESSENILTAKGMLALYDIHNRTIAIGKGTKNSYDKICHRTGNSTTSPCNPPISLIELWEFNRTKIANLSNEDIINAINKKPLISPLTQLPINVDLLVGGPANIKNEKIVSARVLRAFYRLKNQEEFDSGKGLFVDEAAEEFEENFENEMSKGLAGYSVFYYTLWGDQDAASESANGDLQFFVVGYILVIIYLAVMLGSFSRLNHKVFLAFGGIAVIGISIGIAYGLGSAFQLKKTGVQDILPFLLLGIGVDDVFVIIQTWDNVGGPISDGRSVAQKISATLKHAGVSILVTSVTDVCAFFIGATTILPGLRSFCVWAGVGIIAVFIYTITFFTALLTLDARRQDARRDACLCCIKLSPEWEPMECSKKSYLQLFIKNVYGPAVTSVPGKIIGLLLTAGLLSGGIVGLTNLEQDFDPNLFLPSSSAPRQYIDNEKIFFPSHGVISEVYTGGLDYYGGYVEMNNIVTLLEQDQYVADGTIDSWYNNFHVWLSRTYGDQLINGSTCSKCQAPNETIFYTYLREYLQTDEGQFYQNSIVFDDRTGKIKGSSIEFRHVIFENAAEEIKGMDSVQADIRPGIHRDIGETNSLLPFVFAVPYISWETNKVITEELVRNIILAAVCVFLVTLFLISNLLVSIVVLLCVVIALANLAGYMHFWGLTIDTVTTIIIVLAIGLTVDYSAHLGHAFMISKKGNRNERMIDALTEIGPAVIHGGMSTFLAFILLAASESYVFFTFFKVFFLVVVFGIFQGLVFLPVVLSLIGPKPYEDHGEEGEEKTNDELFKHKKPTEQVQTQRIKSLNDVVIVTDAKGAVDNKEFKVEY